ncbi:MAG TPA: choice-of-anchor D domain-containing protein, partial [Candidatus Limnocylindria bacterium]|nr:choice-of-anchor D domain-containing protein [Candidatus Limnocylindria bacterium]
DLGGGVDGVVYALTFDGADNLYAGGYFYSAGGVTVQGVAKWDPLEATWSPLGSGLDSGANAVVLNSTGDLYVGGDFFIAGNKVSPFIAEFLLNFAGIAVENDTTPLEDGVSTVDFGFITFGGSTNQSFTITNSGNLSLTGLAIAKDGPNAADFTVDTTGMLTTLAPGDSTSFSVVFAPVHGGTRTAALHIASNAVGDSNPFDIALTAYGDVSPATIDLDNTSVDENQPAHTVVGLLSATDLDPGDTFTFSLHCGCFDNDLFEVVGNELRTRAPFDFEAQSSYIVFIHAVNVGGESFDQSFGININDVEEAPVFGGYSFTTLADRPATIALPKLFARISDPESDSVSMDAIDPASVQGGLVELLSTSVKYTPPPGFTGNDSFTITLGDGTLQTVGTVFITVDNGPVGTGAATLSVTAVDADVELKFAGIPGTAYLIQRSETLTSPVTWTTLTNLTANAGGQVIYTDPSPPSPSYWRTITAP